MSRVPHPYAAVPKLSANARAVLAGARLTWDEITKREREALLAATPGGYLFGGRTSVISRLHMRGLITNRGALTMLGRLVREVGLATRVEVPDA